LEAFGAGQPFTYRPFKGSLMPTLRFRKLSLTDFRNYTFVELVLDGRSVVLTGPNGAGKTNILEAVSMLSPGRGLRGARLDELCRNQRGDNTDIQRPWAVSALLDQDGDEVRIGTGLEPGGQGLKRIVRIDGQSASGPGALGTYFSVVWLTPQLDRLFAEGASQRRRFLDRLVLGAHAGHSKSSSTFEKAARDRQKLLETAKDGGRADPEWLSALEAHMAQSAIAISAARLDFVERLQGEISRREDDGSAFPKAGLHLQGALEEALGRGRSALEVEDWYAAALLKQRSEDARAGRVLLGPNRSDLEVTFGARDDPGRRLAKACSTGEQKALLIGIVLANAGLKRGLTAGAPPILLLDEVAAHLDPGRRGALFDELTALDAQAFMTGTEAALFEGFGARAQYLNVANGGVTVQGSN
jgi:DNA replication and repair protein RecF